MEMMGFLILAVTIIGIILFMRTNLVSSYGRTFSTLTSRQETEGMRSGVNSILLTTEEKSKKTILELIGTAVYNEKHVLNFGPVVGNIDVKKELEWRFDSIFGEGKWYLKIKPPEIIPPIQVIMILDSSTSLCDDVKDIKENLLPIIKELREEDKKNITATIYMLPGAGGECCGDEKIEMICSKIKLPETPYIHCVDFENIEIPPLPIDIFPRRSDCTNPPQNEEDWGRGLSCAIEKGPWEGWLDESIKVGIVISDEVSYGSELDDGNCNVNLNNEKSLKIGINSAKNNKMKIFSIKTSTGKNECLSCSEDCEPNICMMWYDDIEHWQNTWVERWIFTKEACECDQKLEDQMKNLSQETEGKFYPIERAEEVSESIREIFTEIEVNRKYVLEAGNSKPSNKNIKSHTITIPVPYTGEYTDLNIYYWS